MKNSINCMKSSIAKILIVSVILAFSTMPVFAADPDTTYFESNSRYYWTGASGTHDLPSGTKLGNLVAKGINFLSLDLASLQSTLSQIGSTLNTTINTNTKPLIDLKSGWGSTLNLYTVPSGYGSSWYAQIVRGLYDIKDLDESIKSLLYTATGNQTTIINKLNSGIDVSLDSTLEGYIQNSSEQLTTISGINQNIVSNTSAINNSVLSLVSKISRTISRGYNFVGGRGSSGTSNVPSASNGIVVNTSSPNVYIPFYTSSSNNSMQHTFISIDNATITDFMYLLTNNVSQFGSRIFTPYTIYRTRATDYEDGVANDSYFAYSLSDMIWSIQRTTSEYFSRMGYIYADDDTISARNANKPQEQSIYDNFTGSGDASASVSDIGTAKDTLVGVKSGLNTGTSATQIIGVFNNDEGYNWFSNAVAQDINPSNTRSNGTAGYSTPLLDEKMNALYSVMGVRHD